MRPFRWCAPSLQSPSVPPSSLTCRVPRWMRSTLHRRPGANGVTGVRRSRRHRVLRRADVSEKPKIVIIRPRARAHARARGRMPAPSRAREPADDSCLRASATTACLAPRAACARRRGARAGVGSGARGHHADAATGRARRRLCAPPDVQVCAAGPITRPARAGGPFPGLVRSLTSGMVNSDACASAHGAKPLDSRVSARALSGRARSGHVFHHNSPRSPTFSTKSTATDAGERPPKAHQLNSKKLRLEKIITRARPAARLSGLPPDLT